MENDEKGLKPLIKRISELEEENAALREAEKKLRLMIDNEYDGIVVIRDERILFYNRRFFDFTGTTPETVKDLKPSSIFDFIHPDDWERVMLNHAKRILGERVKPYNIRLVDLSGRSWWIEIRGVSVIWDGKPATLNFLRNITRQINAENQVRSLTRQLLQAQEAERLRISLDLHDTVVQDLAALRLKVDASVKEINSGNSHLKPTADELRGVANHLGRIVDNLRTLIWNMYPINLNDYGLVKALRTHCERFSEKHNIRVDFDANGMDNLELRREKEINIYRIVQEALNNIARHAEAREVMIRLLAIAPDIMIRIHDDGKGFDKKEILSKAADRKQIGLRSITERAKSFGGTAEIQSRSGQGTRILLTIPSV